MRLLIQLANGELEPPFGETAYKETIDVGGVKVKLRMPVMDSRGSYDILLGRDWLHMVSTIGNYRTNQYVISKDGKEVTLAGCEYTTVEVELPEDSDDSDQRSSLSSSSSKDDSDDSDVIIAPTFRAQCVKLENFNVCPVQAIVPKYWTTVVDELETRTINEFKQNGTGEPGSAQTKCRELVLARPMGLSARDIHIEPDEHVRTFRLEISQLTKIDINPQLSPEQKFTIHDLLWEHRDQFATTLEDLGTTHVIEHEIKLKEGAQPFYCPGIK